MHKPIPFIGSKEVEGRASVFQTKRPGFTQKDDGVKSHKSNQLEQKVSSGSGEQTGRRAQRRWTAEHPFISQSKRRLHIM